MAVGWLSLATLLALLLASLYFIWSFYQPRRERAAQGFLALAFVLASATLVAQGLLVQGFPAVTLGGFATLLVWVTAAVLLAGLARHDWFPLAGFVVPVVTVVWMAAEAVAPVGVAALPGALTGAWLVLHVSLATVSYMAFLLSAGAALMYLEKERELREKTPRVFYYRLPALAESDALSGRLAAWGVPFLTATILTGAIWSKMVHGTYWSWTAVEIWSLVTWAVYVGYLALRWRRWQGHRAAWLSIGALVVVAINFFGMTLLFHGWHDYRG